MYHLLARLALDAASPAPALLEAAAAATDKSISCVNGAAAVAVNMPPAKHPAIVWQSRQPACTRAESQLVPVCRQEAMQSLGAWKSASVLTDHISLEVGFSKQACQAQCLTVDYGGGEEKFVHLKKITLVSSSCGWPELQKVELASCACHGCTPEQIVRPVEQTSRG